ncbi:unnamed protein product [Musa acuminata subsp. malaccensis]|uniref:(wild Malaysian banana) hypothetical protein n=1 Tax=Musa acuminata subsp. malaccensis TaxID=214687 RepID=A0A804K6C5_MUSAM|nr:unnamed protein product [Musa acuminata subsp. malaccensis]
MTLLYLHGSLGDNPSHGVVISWESKLRRPCLDEDGQQGSIQFWAYDTLPDKKLSVFILDRLQKCATLIYGVFSEPVDPKELQDYHEVTEHPMDFGTVPNKLYSRAYTNLEQFEVVSISFQFFQ